MKPVMATEGEMKNCVFISFKLSLNPDIDMENRARI